MQILKQLLVIMEPKWVMLEIANTEGIKMIRDELKGHVLESRKARF